MLSLDLSENNITWIHSDAFSTLSQERLTVELWGNPILCDCNMKEFKAWIEEVNLCLKMSLVMSIVYDPISKRLDVICEPVTQKRPSQAKTLK